MSDNGTERERYLVNVHEQDGDPTLLVFTFVPKGLQAARSPGEGFRRVPQYVVVAQLAQPGVSLDWGRTPDDPQEARESLESAVMCRIQARDKWMALVSDLVGKVEEWVQALGWSTRRIEKRIDDSYVGKHRVPALLMQEGTLRVLLEPIGRAAPGSEGVVDLYLLPAYDDIASLYFYNGRWNIHYAFSDAGAPGTIRDTPGLPLSPASLDKVLGEMRSHAA